MAFLAISLVRLFVYLRRHALHIFLFLLLAGTANAQTFTGPYVGTLTIVNVGTVPVNWAGIGDLQGGGYNSITAWFGGYTETNGVYTTSTTIQPGVTYTTLNGYDGHPDHTTSIPFELVISYQDAANPAVTDYKGYYQSAVSGGSMTYNVTAGVDPTFTNYTFTVSNTDSNRSSQAYWIYNGATVKTETLAPGTSDTWTTPNIEVTPTPQNFTINYGENYLNPTIVPGTDGAGNPTLGFSPSSGGSSSGTQSGSGGSGPSGGTGGGSTGGAGGTNGVSGASGISPTMAPTNGVIYPVSGSNADNATMQAGFNLLHQDNLNSLAGQSILNTTLQTGFFMVTNELGQIITYNTMQSNDTWLVVSAITNLGAKLPDFTNFAGATSNVWVQNWPTNPPPSTNYATENTQIGISNLLAALVNNTNTSTTNYNIPSSATNADGASAAATLALGTGLSDAITGATNSLASYLGQDVPDGSPPSFLISIPLAGVSFDMNPVSRWPWFFDFFHAGMTWLIVVAFVTGAVKIVYDVIQNFGAAQTGGVPDMDITGGGELAGFGGNVGGNFVGWTVALIIPAVFISLWVAALTLAFSAIVSWFIGSSPQIFGSSFPSGGMYLINQTIPVALLFSTTISLLILKISVAGLMTVSIAASRFLMGK